MTGLAMLMYMSDNDDLSPRAHETTSVFAVLYPYAKNVGIFKSENPGGHFLLNEAVAGVVASQIPDPTHAIMFYEDKAWPDGSRLATFCDGRAQALTANDWKKVEKSLHLKLKHTAGYLPKGYWKSFHVKGLPGSEGG